MCANVCTRANYQENHDKQALKVEKGRLKLHQPMRHFEACIPLFERTIKTTMISYFQLKGVLNSNQSCMFAVFLLNNVATPPGYRSGGISLYYFLHCLKQLNASQSHDDIWAVQVKCGTSSCSLMTIYFPCFYLMS